METVKTLLIASGGGTDANAIMERYTDRCLKFVEIVALMSTVNGAECLDKAKTHKIQDLTIARSDYKDLDEFNIEVAKVVKELEIKLIFLVGCIHKIYPIEGVLILNIHPAEPEKFGGDTMHGLKVHERVLADIIDRISRGKASVDDVHYTYPTIHEAVLKYDSGDVFMQTAVKVPKEIILACIKCNMFTGIPQIYAEVLREHVLPYEWLMLPAAVEMAAKKIIDERVRG